MATQSHTNNSASYDSLLYPKQTSNTGNILPNVSDNTLNVHPQHFQSKAVGGSRKKRATVIRKNRSCRNRKSMRRKSKGRRNKH